MHHYALTYIHGVIFHSIQNQQMLKYNHFMLSNNVFFQELLQLC
jgi:hypothetical protein